MEPLTRCYFTGDSRVNTRQYLSSLIFINKSPLPISDRLSRAALGALKPWDQLGCTSVRTFGRATASKT